MNIVRFCVLAVSIACAGCANRPTPVASAINVSKERVFPAYWHFQSADAAHVRAWITRDINYAGSAAAVRFFIDGEAIATLKNGEGVSVFLPPKQYLFGVQRDPTWGQPKWEQTYNIEKKGDVYFRIGVGADHFFVMPTSETR